MNLYVILGIIFFYILSLLYFKKKYVNTSPLLYIGKIKRKETVAVSNIMGVKASKQFKIGDVIGNIAILRNPKQNPIYTKYGKYVQHSNKPNIVLRSLKFANIIYLYGIAIKNIKPHQEIVYDYNDIMAPKPNEISSIKNNSNIYKLAF